MTDRVRPFYCGTQYLDWLNRNCFRCAKVEYDDDPDKCRFDCEIEKALSRADTDDGTIAADLARRMDCTGKDYLWGCPERQPT